MREKEHQLKLCIKGDYDSRNILKGIIVSGETPQFFKGESSFYYVEDGYLNRISQPCAEILGPIIEMSPYKRVRLEFGRKAFADFYHHVMPMLGEYVEFEDMEPDILDTYVPPKAEFKFYLDAETDVITCDTKVIYDEDRGLFIGERDEESVFAVLERGVNELLTLGEVFCTDRLKRITIRKKTPLSVGVSLESGIMNLDISSEEYSNEELLEILGSYRKRKKYHQLKNGEYEDKQFLYQVLDEAQYIKNHTTAVAKAVKCINSKTKYALTGTPIENRLSELWSIFDYLMPGFLYGYENFRKELEAPITKNKDEEASNRLKRMISPFILRRLKQDVLTDLPDKLEEIQYAKFEPKQQKLYDGQVVHMKEMLEKQSGTDFAQSKIQILAELTKLRQICCDPSLLFENFDGESAKRQACMDLIKSAIEGEHRMLVFSQFTSMLSLLEEDLTKEGIVYYKITGSTSKEERIRLVKEFNDGEVPVFLISLKAGGTGLNLVGADVVIHYDPWWNQAVQNQATDRAHRIGQEKVVTVYKLIAKGTIEEKIVKLQESKKNLADEILSGENGGLAQLSREELLELL